VGGEGKEVNLKIKMDMPCCRFILNVKQTFIINAHFIKNTTFNV